jgi:TetR/AcrR family transcriptional regulator, transcriptional repressor for nem operon
MRDPEKTRTSILESAFDVVYKRGFRATSVSDIVRKAGVTQGAFFHYFATKNDLGYALVDEILKDMMLNRWIRPLAAYKSPVQGMIVRFRKNTEEGSYDMSLGCPLNNLIQEMSTVDPVFRDKTRAVITAWIEGTERYLRKAQAEGYLRPDVDVRKASEFIVMVEEGSAGLMKSLLDQKVYTSLYETFRHYLESLMTDKDASETAKRGIKLARPNLPQFVAPRTG